MKTDNRYLLLFFLCWAFLYGPVAMLTAFGDEGEGIAQGRDTGGLRLAGSGVASDVCWSFALADGRFSSGSCGDGCQDLEWAWPYGGPVWPLNIYYPLNDQLNAHGPK